MRRPRGPGQTLHLVFFGGFEGAHFVPHFQRHKNINTTYFMKLFDPFVWSALIAFLCGRKKGKHLLTQKQLEKVRMRRQVYTTPKMDLLLSRAQFCSLVCLACWQDPLVDVRSSICLSIQLSQWPRPPPPPPTIVADSARTRQAKRFEWHVNVFPSAFLSPQIGFVPTQGLFTLSDERRIFGQTSKLPLLNSTVYADVKK